ncbi:MAG: UvrD-helicase domain-containing protein [Acidobacteria bacterium]|nr:UvrD-helicase domain-containing protein [Acidobacteriota bacterium]
MDILAGLNPQQRIAVEHGQGPALVLAGAGSGKTRVIAHRIAYLIGNMAARPENILAVTFTNKAAREMRERVQKIVGVSRSAEPLISTFHSFCVRLLRREIPHIGYKRDFSIYDTDDQKRLIRQILDEEKNPDLDISPREVISRISYAKNHGVSPDQYTARFPSQIADDVQHIYGQYNARLQQSNSLDFDDLLLKSVDLLRKVPEARKYYGDWYKYILVDEYQDTNRPQYELLRLLTSVHKNLFVVGDEDQSIYKFRGADIQNILKFEKDFPGARIIKLEQNYRSSQNILRIAGAVVENNTERKGKTLWTENDSGDIITCHCEKSAREEAGWVASRIREVLLENPDCHVAVLYRANFLSRNFEDALTEKGIPYAVVGSVAFFSRMEVKDLLAYLRIVFNPEDDVALLRIINTPPRGIGNAAIDMLTEAALNRNLPILQVLREKARDPQVSRRFSRPLLRFQELVDKWTAIQESSSIAQLLEAVLNDTQYREMLQKQETATEAENRMANIDELIRAAAESEERGETIADFLDRASLASELDHLDPNARVALMTLHSAKGLEFDVVFLAGMEEGLFPHSQSMDSNEDIEEERRLCYVGITRAKRKLFITWTPFRKNYGPEAGFASKMSRFLKEMPQDLIEGLDEPDYFDQRPQHRSYFHEAGARYEEISKHKGYQAKIREEELPQPKTIAELKAYLQQKERASEAAGSGASAGPVFKAGMRVRHEQFGEGIVLSRERTGNDIKLVVAFSRVGKKSLIERYAKLKAL